MEIISLDHITVTITTRLIRKTINHHTICIAHYAISNYQNIRFQNLRFGDRKYYTTTGLYLYWALARLGREAPRHT